MIKGVVNRRQEAIIRLRLRGPNATGAEIDAVVDTGFNGSLTLPLPMVESLGLVRRAGGSAILADGSIRSYGIHAVDVEWDGIQIEVLVSAVGEEPLLGMRLLKGYELRIEVNPGGRVEVRKLP